MSDNQDARPPAPLIERRRGPRVIQAPLGADQVEEAALVPLRFETAGLPRDQQFSAWREHMAVLYDTRLPDDAAPEDGFVAQQTVWNLDGMLFLQQTTPAFSYERSPEMVRFSPIDHWQITVLRTGRTWTAVDQRVAQNEPGMIEICSLGYPFKGRALAHDSIGLIVPADLFADRGNLPTSSNNNVLGGHRAKILSDYILSVEASLDRLTRSDLPSIRNRLWEMVFDTVMPLVAHDERNDQISQIGLMVRARQFILNNLASPNLTPDALARELATSRTRLYELFETSGGVAKYIRQHRLSAAHAILADPSDARTIADVGIATGYDSAANFSRAFTHQFGYSPRNIRKHAPGVDTRPGSGSHKSTPVTFEHLLRTLGLF